MSTDWDPDELARQIMSDVGQVSEPRDGKGGMRPKDDDADNTAFDFVLARDISVMPKAHLIEGFLGRQEVSAWYGPPDAGKSTVTIDAGGHVAAGLDYCGRAVEQGAVLYVAAERGAIVRRRVKAWCLEQERNDIPLAVVDAAVELRSNKLDADRIITNANRLANATGKPVVWIIFDTFNRVLAGGDENSSKDVGAVIAAVDRIHRATGAHCSLIHHVPVDRSDRMRGHGSVLGAVDTTIRINKESGVVQVGIDIAKDLVDKPAFAFTFKSVVVVTDDNGNETTAPVLVPTETTPTRAARREARLPKASKIALSALREAIDELGSVPAASSHIPTNVRTVTLEQWRTYAYRRGVSPSETARARQMAFQRAGQHLVAEHHVGTWDELYWLG